MKKKFCTLFAAFVVAFALFCPSVVLADSSPTYVLDEANLLTENQVRRLEEKAADISEKYGCGLYILTVDDFTDCTNSTDAFFGAKQLYLDKNLGWGDEKSGQLLMLSMADRDYALIAYGYGTTAFTEYGNGYICKKFLDDFKRDNWYDGFNDYLDTSARLLKDAANGEPFDRGSATPAGLALGIIVCVLISFLIAWVVLRIFKSALKSVYAGDSAAEYMPQNGVEMKVCTDRYTHSAQSRVHIQPSSSSSRSSGGSSSNFTSSGGFTGSSGKF